MTQSITSKLQTEIDFQQSLINDLSQKIKHIKMDLHHALNNWVSGDVLSEIEDELKCAELNKDAHIQYVKQLKTAFSQARKNPKFIAGDLLKRVYSFYTPVKGSHS